MIRDDIWVGLEYTFGDFGTVETGKGTDTPTRNRCELLGSKLVKHVESKFYSIKLYLLNKLYLGEIVMKWLRYCIVMLSFIMFSPLSHAGKDPIGWSANLGIPAHTVVNLSYPGPIIYTFVNNLPFKMVLSSCSLLSKRHLLTNSPYTR